VLDKPKGPTSHDMVSKLRRALQTREVGHAGTLDPMATGVLVMVVGEGTKLSPYLTENDKEYLATVELGALTDTLDAEGAITLRQDLPPDLLRELSGTPTDLGPALKHACALEQGRTEQVPPAYSAVHVDGQRAYARARRGDAPVLPPRPVVLRELTVHGLRSSPAPAVDVALRVSKGYYVRSFARDFAVALGTLGHLSQLRRLSSGTFNLADAAPGLDAVALRAAVIPLVDVARRALPCVELDETHATRMRQGQRFDGSLIGPVGVPKACFDSRGNLVAVAECTDTGVTRVLRGFRLPEASPTS
jgi:tRNA pseudouridine55 synthase